LRRHPRDTTAFPAFAAVSYSRGGRGFGFLIGSGLAAAWLRASGDARPET